MYLHPHNIFESDTHAKVIASSLFIINTQIATFATFATITKYILSLPSYYLIQDSPQFLKR